MADTVDPLGSMTAYGYDPLGRVTTVTDPLGRVSSFGYDPAGNKVTKADPGGSCPTWPITYPPTLATSAKCAVYGYDVANQLTNVYYSDGVTPNVGPITYDADGQRATMPDGVGTGSKTWSWTRDSLHRLSSVTDDNQATVSYGYDLANNQTSITYPGTVGMVTHHFDAADRMDSLTDPKGNVTAFGYDPDSDQTVTTLPVATGIVDTNTFDNADRLAAMTDKQGATTFASFTYGRTSANQINSVTSTGVPADNHSFGYDPLQRLATTDTKPYGLDGANQLTTTLNKTSQYFDAANQLSAAVAGPGIRLVGTGATDNAIGTTLVVNYPAGTTSGDELVLGVTLAYNNTLTVPSGWTRITKTSSGSTVGTSDTTYVLTHTASSETSVTITFSGTYQRAAVIGAYHGVNITTPVDVSSTATASGLNSLTIPSATTTANGERLVVITGAYSTGGGAWSPPAGDTLRNQSNSSKPGVVGLEDRGQQSAGPTGALSATYTSASQLVGVLVALKPATTQPTATGYGYDSRGNRITVTPPAGSASTLGYDQANRLTSFTKGTTSATYAYSGDGRRMAKTVNAVTSPMVWDPTASLGLLLSDGTNSYVYGPDGSPLEHIDSGGNVSWYHHDQLGTTRVLTNSSGAVVGTFSYDAYGNQTAKTGTVSTPLGYNGQFTDAESGLIYLRARYYDPATGQFLSRDPAVALTQEPYGYVEGNPLNATDPTGLFCGGPLCGAVHYIHHQLDRFQCNIATAGAGGSGGCTSSSPGQRAVDNATDTAINVATNTQVRGGGCYLAVCADVSMNGNGAVSGSIGVGLAVSAGVSVTCAKPAPRGSTQSNSLFGQAGPVEGSWDWSGDNELKQGSPHGGFNSGLRFGGGYVHRWTFGLG